MKEEEEDDCWVPIAQNQARHEPPLSQYQPSNRSSSHPSRASSHTQPARESVEDIVARLETRQHLKDRLVDHPIGLFWSHFLGHLVRELWALDLYIRTGLILILVGVSLKLFLLTTWYAWYPKTFVILSLFVVSYVYVMDLERQLESWLRFFSSPSDLFDALERLNPTQLRRLACGLLFVPTVLETRTLSFLAKVHVDVQPAAFTVGTSLVLLILMLYLKWSTPPRDCTLKGYIFLYGSALLMTIVTLDIRRMPWLAAPFCFATGTLILSSSHDDEWVHRLVRQSLRLTLRDVLETVGESVREDEMLQLAMLRWIVDYWSYTPPPPQAPSGDTSQSPTTQPTSTTPPTSNAIVPSQHVIQPELEWSELFTMLRTTTDQMALEVGSLQRRPSTGTSHANAFEPSSERPRPSSNSSFTQPPTSDYDNDSLLNLKNMLSSLDVDERARPAVMAYKQAVEGFPPSRNVAICISVIRRCPALLALLCHLAVSSTAVTWLLMPFVIFEWFRIQEWFQNCSRSASTEETSPRQVLAQVDPMVIFLSDDDHSELRPPTLLQVWVNVRSSVAALEVGLTAARCVNTTAVAVDFAENILSLAQFGAEVSQYGWWHGVTVMAKELLWMHATESSPAGARAPYPHPTRVTSAALNAVRNGQRVAKNLQALSEEDANPGLAPFLGVLSVVIGHGWLWGREDNPEPIKSTVVITEITDDDDVEVTSPEPNGSQDVDEAVGENSIIPAGQPVGFPKRIEDDNRNDRSTEVLDGDVQHSRDEAGNKSNGTTVQVQTVDSTDSEEKEKITQQEKEDRSREPSEHDSALSEVMDLIALTFERGMIDEAEKNEFLEKLVQCGSSQDEKKPLIQGMKRTLEGLLDSSSDANRLETVARTNPSRVHNEQEMLVERMSLSRDRGVPTVETATTRETDEQLKSEDSHGVDWAPLLGGIAVIGAVAGSILLSGGGNENNEGRRQQENRTSTRDERSEDDDSNWVSVPK